MRAKVELIRRRLRAVVVHSFLCDRRVGAAATLNSFQVNVASRAPTRCVVDERPVRTSGPGAAGFFPLRSSLSNRRLKRSATELTGKRLCPAVPARRITRVHSSPLRSA